jgi:hypothetical protein
LPSKIEYFVSGDLPKDIVTSSKITAKALNDFHIFARLADPPPTKEAEGATYPKNR